MTNKNNRPQKLLWVDLEMTGLDATKDVIIEVAAIITDFDFRPLATYEACIKQPLSVITERMDASPFWRERPAERIEIVAKAHDGILPEMAEAQLVKLVQEHFNGEPAILAGNSIYNDRNFIKVAWPKLDSLLHYRMLDVSALKIIMQGKYDLEFKKTDKHRALSDIKESIAELEHYLRRLSA